MALIVQIRTDVDLVWKTMYGANWKAAIPKIDRQSGHRVSRRQANRQSVSMVMSSVVRFDPNFICFSVSEAVSRKGPIDDNIVVQSVAYPNWSRAHALLVQPLQDPTNNPRVIARAKMVVIHRALLAYLLAIQLQLIRSG